MDDAVAAFYERQSQLDARVQRKRWDVEASLRALRDQVISAHESELMAARDQWEQAKAEADGLLDTAWHAVDESFRAPWDDARAVIREAWADALKVLRPAWERAHELIDGPRTDGERILDEAVERATDRLRDAWKGIMETIEAVNQDMREQMPDVQSGELAPPIGQEAEPSALASALFYSRRPMMEQMQIFHRFQGKPDEIEEEGSG